MKNIEKQTFSKVLKVPSFGVWIPYLGGLWDQLPSLCDSHGWRRRSVPWPKFSVVVKRGPATKLVLVGGVKQPTKNMACFDQRCLETCCIGVFVNIFDSNNWDD